MNEEDPERNRATQVPMAPATAPGKRRCLVSEGVGFWCVCACVFSLSPATYTVLLSVIRGLCDEQRPIIAAEARISAHVART